MKKKKYLGIGLLFVCCFLAGRTAGKLQAAFVPAAQMTVEEAKLAVIIDDFGYNGAGTAEMLALDIPFTAAVLPFSSHTAENAAQAAEAGKEVIGIDRDEDRVRELREYTEYAFVSQTLTKDVLEEVGVQNCDVVIVCIGERIEVSILTTLNVINLGVSKVIAKATNADQGEVLEKLGAQVVYPERDMALRLAKKILRENLVDYISIGKDIEIIEFEISKQMIGKSIIGMRVRENFGLNIIAIHHDGITDTDIDPHYLLKAGDTIAVIGKENKVAQFVDSYS